jgi:hypothetical protein
MRHRNLGVRKRCRCKPKDWPRCPHSWHLNYKPKGGAHYRLSLDREVGQRIEGKTEAIAQAERIRTAIRDGTFRPAPELRPILAPVPTFRAFAEVWKVRRGSQLASAKDDVYRLATICAFVLPGTDPARGCPSSC